MGNYISHIQIALQSVIFLILINSEEILKTIGKEIGKKNQLPNIED